MRFVLKAVSVVCWIILCSFLIFVSSGQVKVVQAGINEHKLEKQYNYRVAIYLPEWNATAKRFDTKVQVFYCNSKDIEDVPDIPTQNLPAPNYKVSYTINITLQDGVELDSGQEFKEYTIKIPKDRDHEIEITDYSN